MIGTKLAHYEIVSPIGKGGMGEVWRARDTKLGREVAIKTLPEEFARDADRLTRFEREAKLLASLNHPNIAAIYGLEEHQGTRFLVLELVEGPTLEGRIKQGAVPVEESLKLALQIAEALEAAHEKGVIHRDLKPANIKVTPDGKVKVLDFGLAKAFCGEEAEANLSQSPTLSMAATQQGIILGTAAYMSPEQASGMPTDKRADIWSFGVVLFEMLTGRQVFTGESVSHILAAVLRADPEWNGLPNIHPRIRLLLERCLEKKVADRYHDIADARVDIQKVLADPSGLLVQPVAGVVQAVPQSKVPWIAAIALGIVVAGVVGWNLKPLPQSERGAVTRSAYALPEGQRFTRIDRSAVALSPDGSRMVYVANQQLYLRAMDSLESAPIPGTDQNPSAPFFSPDGEWIGYWSGIDGQIKKIAISGGAAITLCDAENPYGRPTWLADDTIAWGQGGGIMRVSANGGTPEVFIASSGGGNLGNPNLLPDGDTVLFMEGDPSGGEVILQSLESGERKVLFPGVAPQYVPTGHIVYGTESVLFAVPFDVGSLEVTGGPVPMVEGVRCCTQVLGPVQLQYAVSEDGSLVYVPGERVDAQRTLVWVDRNGVPEPLETIPQGPYEAPRLSPDEERVLLVEDSDVWIYDIATGRRSAVTTDGMALNEAEWSPTGTQVAFSSLRSGPLNVFVQPADGSGTARQLTNLEGRVEVDSWSPVGDVMAVHHHSPEGPVNILMVPFGEDSSEPKDFLVRDFGEMGTVFSPDGRYVAYVSNESGQAEVYIRSYPGPGSQTTVSVGGGTEPVWRDGEIFYRRRTDDHMMAVSVTTDPELEVGDVTELFVSDYFGFGTPPRPDYHVTADRNRFLMLRDVANEPVQQQINIVHNWFEELKQRVPVP